MTCSGAAPCQCHSSGEHQIVSPGRMTTTSPPRTWVRPTPSVTWSVWPLQCLCQAVRAPGVKCTNAARPWARPSCGMTTSIQTSPVNHSAGPLPVVGLSMISMVTPLGFGSDGEQDLGGASFVHGPVALGGLVEGQGEVEHDAGVDGAVPDQLDEPGEEPAHRCGPAVEVHGGEEEVATGELDVVGHADVADMTA